MKKIALLLTGSLCSLGMSFSTYGSESLPISTEQAQIYLDLLENTYDYTYVTSHLHDLTGDTLPELLVSYQSEDPLKQGIQTDIWQVLDGELSPVVFDGASTDSLSIVTDTKGNSYLFSESNKDMALSGGIMYHIYSYKDGGIAPIYELSRVETFLWDDDSHSYDTSSPLETFIENGLPVKDTLSSTDLYDEMEETYQLNQKILIYQRDETFSQDEAFDLETEEETSDLETLEEVFDSENPDNVSHLAANFLPSVLDFLQEVIYEAKYAHLDTLTYQELLTHLPYTGDFAQVTLPEAQAQAFLQVLQNETEAFETWKESFSQKIGFFHSATETTDSVDPDVFVAFFPIGDGSIAMLANHNIYTWHHLTGLQQVCLPMDWNLRIFETEYQEVYVEYYRSSSEDSYFYAGLHRAFRNGSLVDTGYKSFQWCTEDLDQVADMIFEETGVDLSGKLNEVAGKTENALEEPIYQLHFYQEQMVDALPFSTQDKTALLTCFIEEFPSYEGNFLPYQHVKALLERLISKAEHYTLFPLLTNFDSLLQPISNDLSHYVTSEMIENLQGVYDLGENLYYLVIQEDTEPHGVVIGKGVKDGFERYYLVDTISPLMLEEELQILVHNHQNQSNISIDYEKMEDCVEPEDFLLLLEESLSEIHGTAVNQIALSEITQYIELSLERVGQVSVGSKENYYEITKETFSDSCLLQQDLKSDFEKLLFNHQISLGKNIEATVQIVVQNIDANQPIHLHLDSSLQENLGGSDLTILIAGTSYQIGVRGAHLSHLLTEHGFAIRLIPGNAGTVTLQFENGLGKIIPTLEVPISVTLYCNSYFATVFNNTEDRLIPWGGQYDTANKTISFQTFASGKFELLDNSIEISDISHLEDITKDAIIYLTSKGLFHVTKGNFNPEDSLTRNELAKILSTLCYVTDDSLSSTYQDVDKDDPYAPYIASTEKYNLLSGYTDTEFRGDLPVSVEQVLVLIARTLWELTASPLPEFPEDYQFTGLSDANSWSQPFLALAHRDGIILHGEKIIPDADLTREDAAVYFYRLFQILYPNKPVHFEVPIEYIEVTEEPEPVDALMPNVPQGGGHPVEEESFGANEKEFAMAAGAIVGLILLLGFFRIINRKQRKSKKKTSIILSMDELPEYIIDLEEVVEETAKNAVPTYQEKETQEEIAQEEIAQEEIAQEEIAQEEIAQEEIAQEEIAQEEIAQEETIQQEPLDSIPLQSEPFVPPVVYPTEETNNSNTKELFKLEEQRPHIKPLLLIQSTEPL